MTRKLFSMLLLSSLPALAVAGEGHAKDAAATTEHKAEHKAELKKMTVDQVSAKVAAKEQIYVFDNNSAERYAKGHVPGAVWVDYKAVQASQLPASKDATLVFYCANEKCMACHKAAYTAHDLGYKNVFIMPEGIMGWEKAEKPVEKGEPSKS